MRNDVGFGGLEIFGGFPKLGVPFWGFQTIRIIVFEGLYWGHPYIRKLPFQSWGRQR